MCDILAVNANKPVPVQLSWRAFAHRGQFNPHGWGFSYLADGGFVLRRYVTNLADNPAGPSAPASVRTRHFLAHVRYRVQGGVSPDNTQPFLGSTGALALAATMSRCRVTSRFRDEVSDVVQGDTGPEILMALLQRSSDILDVIRRVFLETPLGPGARASFVLSDGHAQTAFSYNRSLFVTTRRPPHDSVVRLRDPTQTAFAAELRLEKEEDEIASVVASVALTNERWVEIGHRELIVIRDGVIEHKETL